MKARLPHQFYIMASQFSIKSMLESVSNCAFEVFNNPSNDFGSFAANKHYSIIINGSGYKGHTLVVQTWLIDLIYDISCLEHAGIRQISRDETLHLIALYDDLSNKRDGDKLKSKKDALLNVFGFFGEQKKFQSKNEFFDDFSREKYILEVISEKCLQSGTSAINTAKVFQEETGYSFDNYSALVFLTFGYFCSNISRVTIDNISTQFNNPLLSKENLTGIIERYSITLDQIKAHSLKRQIFYTKPIIKIDNEYISVNPFLLLYLFTNSNYWVIRNCFFKNQSQDFTNAFGKYFECYVQEILDNCMTKDEYSRIKETDNDKRADWIITTSNHTFLVEQKSSLPLLGIKQNQTDICKMKKYIIDCWGEACKQLKATEEALNIFKPIKIVLIYEDYYKSECLDELFKLDSNIENDGRYWLLNIKEFESLLLLYKDNPSLFENVICEKEQDEIIHCSDGRELQKYFYKYNIQHESYLRRFGIANQFNKIVSICK